MSSLSNVEAKLPPGFRFHPRDDELICDYLMKWISGCPNQFPLLIEVDLNKCEPWDIPETASVGNKECYFYSQKDKKYATGLRTNRATLSGYWKATGKDRHIIRNRNLVGMRKTLVFYTGRAPKGKKTEWVMHEFRLEGTHWPGPAETVVKDGWVLCRVFYKNRSDIRPTKPEPAFSSDDTSSQPLPMDIPYISFDPVQPAASTIDHYDEQVPCFSMNQICPAFSLYGHMNDELMSPKIMSFEQIMPDLGNYDSPNSCDNKVMMRAVMDHITKIENSCNDIGYNPISSTLKGTISSPSFGEGSPDSYLSEVDLSSMWNQY